MNVFKLTTGDFLLLYVGLGLERRLRMLVLVFYSTKMKNRGYIWTAAVTGRKLIYAWLVVKAALRSVDEMINNGVIEL